MSVAHIGVNQTPTIGNDGSLSTAGKSQTELALELNSCRIIVVADQLLMCAKSPDQHFKFHQLCLSLARKLDDVVEEALQDNQHFQTANLPRGIDYGLANNEVPAAALKLPHVLKEVCSRKKEIYLQAGIMVLMISVKNACKLGWFNSKDTEELLTLADEVASYFVTKKDLNTEVSEFLPTISTIMSRYYPRFKLGQVIASLEVKPGYGTHLIDFHISKDITVLKEEKIRLFVALKDNIDTSSCIITPQQVNILLNGKPVEHRNSLVMDHAPQLPTIVNPSLKYGINLLQVMGLFTGHYIFVVALMSVVPSSGLQIPADYVQPVSAVSSSDSELIEGPFRVSLKCPISKSRIGTPVKGKFCKHYQCFDFSNYVEINYRRPFWRCPSCNQSVCFTDLRIDQNMVKILQEVGKNISEVIVFVDGTWTTASSDKHKDESHDKTSANQQGGHELEETPGLMDASDNMYDLTGEDDEMDTDDRCEPVDTKPIVHHTTQGQSVSSNITLPSMSGSTSEPIQYSSGQGVNTASPRAVLNSGSTGFNFRPQGQIGGSLGTLTGNGGVTPVWTDAVSPVLNRQADNFQGTNHSTSGYAQISAPAPTSTQMQEALFSAGFVNNHSLIPRNVTRVSSAIQALPVPVPTTTPQQHSRPTVNFPAGSGSPALQRPAAGSIAHPPTYYSNAERQRYHSLVSAHMSSTPSISPVNRSPSPVVGLANPSHNIPMPQTLSQPPHLMRTSQLPRNHIQQGAAPRTGVSNSPSTVQRVQLTPQQAPHMRQQPQTMPVQTQAARMAPSFPLNSGSTGATPQAVSRTESLIDLQAEQNWRPSGRMRGALTGKAYSDALNQYMGQAAPPVQAPSSRPPVQMPSSRPPVSSSSLSLPPNINVLLANRRIASELQDQSATASGTVGSQEEGSQGAK